MDYSIIDMSLGKALHDRREQLKMTIREVSERTGIKKSSYSYYENGDRSMPTDTFIKLCGFYGLNHIDLMKEAQAIMIEVMKADNKKAAD